MAQYSRVFITLIQDRAGYGQRSREPSGRAIIEVKNGRGKVSLAVHELKGEMVYKAYIVSSAHDGLAVKLGSLCADERGKAEIKWEFDPLDVEQTNISIDAFDVVAVIVQSKGENAWVLTGYRDGEVRFKDKFNEAVKREKAIIETQAMPEPEVMQVEVEELPEESPPPETPSEVIIEFEPMGMFVDGEPETTTEPEVKAESVEVQPQPEPESEPEAKAASEPVEIQSEAKAESKLDPNPMPEPMDAQSEAETVLELELEPTFEPEETQSEPKPELEPNPEPMPEPIPEPKPTTNPPEPPLDAHTQFKSMAQKFNRELEELESLMLEGVNPENEPKFELDVIMKNNLAMLPFKTGFEEVKWVKISLKELTHLPCNLWKLMYDPYVNLVCNRHKHMMLGAYSGRPRYILALPDAFDPSRERHAKMLGFDIFRPSDNIVGERRGANYGYWLMEFDG